MHWLVSAKGKKILEKKKTPIYNNSKQTNNLMLPEDLHRDDYTGVKILKVNIQRAVLDIYLNTTNFASLKQLRGLENSLL